MSSFWDQNYSQAEGYKYGETPNAFLVQEAHRLARPGCVLVPGDGEGRNGVWLAEQGFEVHTLDGSGVGVAKARALAERRGVSLDAQQVDLAEWEPAPAGFSGAAIIYLHLPPALRVAVHHKVVRALQPGGILILETFHSRQLEFHSGGPKDPDMLYTLDMLRADFADGMDELLGQECDTTLTEGAGHEGHAFVTRWIGRRLA